MCQDDKIKNMIPKKSGIFITSNLNLSSYEKKPEVLFSVWTSKNVRFYHYTDGNPE